MSEKNPNQETIELNEDAYILRSNIRNIVTENVKEHRNKNKICFKLTENVGFISRSVADELTGLREDSFRLNYLPDIDIEVVDDNDNNNTVKVMLECVDDSNIEEHHEHHRENNEENKEIQENILKKNINKGQDKN